MVAEVLSTQLVAEVLTGAPHPSRRAVGQVVHPTLPVRQVVHPTNALEHMHDGPVCMLDPS